jgi:hypothetical protein
MDELHVISSLSQQGKKNRQGRSGFFLSNPSCLCVREVMLARGVKHSAVAN